MDLALNSIKLIKPFQALSLILPYLIWLGFQSDLKAQVEVRLDQTIKVGDTLVEIYSLNFGTEMGNPVIRAFHQYKDGSMYLLSRSGLFHWRPDSFYLVPQSSRLNTQDISYSLEDREGRIWFYPEWFMKNAPITNLISFMPHSDEPFKNPIQNILDSDETIAKLAGLDENIIAFQTNRNRLIIYEKSDTYKFVSIDDDLQLLGSSGKQLILGKYSGQTKQISLLNSKTEEWEHFPPIKENWRIDHCVIQNGGMVCVSERPNFRISIFDREDGKWSYQEAPDELFHYFYSCDIVQFQSIDGKEFHTLSIEGLEKSILKNAINSALNYSSPQHYFFCGDQNWILVEGNLYFLRVLSKMNFLTILDEYPDRRISTRGLFQLDNQTLLAGTYAGLFEIDLSGMSEGTFNWRNTTAELACPITYVQGFKKSRFRDSTIIFYSSDVFLYNYYSGNCEIYGLKVLGSGDIWDVIELDDDNLMIGSTTGLYTYNLPEKTLLPFNISDEKSDLDLHGISINRINKGDTPNTYWLSTMRGLLKIEIKGTGGKVEGHLLQNLIPNTSVHDIQKLGENKLAATTTQQGLLILEKKEYDWDIVQKINSENFLAENSAHSLEVDELGRIWLGTDNGLYLVDLEFGVARRFDVTHGLTHNEFNRLSSYQLPNGYMIFGGLNGYNFFNPSEFNSPQSEFSLGIHSLKLHPKKILTWRDQIKPNEGFYTIEIPSHTTKITPQPAIPFSALTTKIYYRFNDNYTTWRVAENGRIPLPDKHPNPSLKVELLFELTSGDLLLSDFPLEIKFVKDSLPLKTLLLILIGVTGLFYLSYLFLRSFRKTPLEDSSIDIKSEQGPKAETGNSPGEQGAASKTTLEQSPVQTIKENKTIIPEPDAKALSKNSEEQRELLGNTDSTQDDFDEEYLNEVHSVISDNLSDSNFNVTEMAKLLMLSKRQLFRVTKEKTGMTPHKILTDFRLEKARKLLEENPDLTISEVTYSVGMSKPSYLSKIFKEKFGLTIKKYKKELKNK